MAFKDLREWIVKLEEEGELARIKTKVDWNLEIGGILRETFDRRGPALLFENIKDHENTICKKLFAGSLATYPRIALMMGLPKNSHPKELITGYMRRIEKPIKPVVVKTGPVKENIIKADKVDLYQFPAPKWQYRDGGRYIGTCDGVILKDPETGWQNVGLYRRMIHDRNHTGITIIHGGQTWMMWTKYKDRGAKTIPVAVACGWDPVLPMMACSYQPPQVSEYDMMGAIRQEPVELVKCESCDLEVPASAEIVLEGEISLDSSTFRHEGPFGEYCGYYTSRGSDKPVVTWNCITHRNDPILQGTLEGRPINEDHRMESINHSALLWKYLNEQVRGVTGVNVHPSTGWSNVFIQVDNSYIGQPQQVACAVWGSYFSNQVGKNVMVVDTDIDIFDLNDLAWAFAYRVDPPRDIQQMTGIIGPGDPVKHADTRIGLTTFEGTKLLIDATKYWGHPKTDKWFGEKFAPVAYPDEETMKMVRSKWDEYGISQ